MYCVYEPLKTFSDKAKWDQFDTIKHPPASLFLSDNTGIIIYKTYISMKNYIIQYKNAHQL